MAFDAGDIESRLILDRRQFDRELEAAERKAEAFERRRFKAMVGLELDASQARRDLERFKRELAGIKDIHIKARLDDRSLRRDLRRSFREINRSNDVRIRPVIDRGHLRREVASATRNLRSTVRIDADFNNFRARDLNATANYDVQLDGAAAQAEATALARSLHRTVEFTVDLDAGNIRDQVNGLAGGSNRSINFDIDVDSTDAVNGLREVQQETVRVEDSFNDVDVAVGRSTSKIALYGGIAAAALGPVSAAVVGLPGLLMAAVAPIGAIALGMDGIKQAATPLLPLFNNLKREVSATFQEGLEPAIQRTAALMPTLERGFVGSARATSELATGIMDVVSSTQGLETIDQIFQDINQGMLDGIPAAQLLVENFLALAEMGTGALADLPAMMNAVGLEWQNVIQYLEQTGVGEEAVRQLLSVISELLGLIAPLVQLGAELMAVLGPPLAGAIEIVTVALQALADLFGMLPGPIQTAVAALAAFRIAMALIGRNAAAQSRQVDTLTQAMRNVGLGAAPVAGAMTGAAGGVQRFGSAAGTAAPKAGLLARAGSGLVGAFGGPWGIAITTAVVGLASLGTEMQNAQQRALESKQAIVNFADAMRASGSAVSTAVQAQVEARSSALGLNLALRQTGTSTRELTGYLNGANPEFARLTQQVLEGGNSADRFSTVLHGVGQNLIESGGAASAFGGILQGAAAFMNHFGTGAGDSAKALDQLNREFDKAVPLSEQMTQSHEQLVSNLQTFGTVSDNNATRVAALNATYKALIDDTMTAGQVTQVAAGYYMLASDGARNMATANLANVASLKDFESVMGEINPALIDSKGNIDLWAEGGLEMQSAALQAAQGIDQLFAATLQSTGSMVEAGAKAAAARQQFIEMGVAAGVPREAMMALAESIMAIPPEVKASVSMPGGAEAAAQALGLGDAIVAIPDEKTVHIETDNKEALAALEALGLKVTEISPGVYEVTAQDNATPIIDAIPGVGNIIPPANVPVEATDNATPTINAIPGIGNVIPPANVDVTATDNASSVINSIPLIGASLVPGVGNIIGVNVPVDATDNASPVINGIPGVGAPVPSQVNVNATDNASGVINGIPGVSGPITATIVVGVTDNASATINRIRTGASIAISIPIGITDNASASISRIRTGAAVAISIPIGITDNATSAINGIKTAAAREVLFPFGIIDNATGPINDIKALAAEPAEFTVDANTDAAQAEINALKQPTSSTHTVNIVINGTLPRAVGGIVAPGGIPMMANGGILGSMGMKPGDVIEGYAGGGLRQQREMASRMASLRPMQVGKASIIPPNTWRVIGDRSQDDEAYIPINRSQRSRSILKTTAAMMGFQAIDMRPRDSVGTSPNPQPHVSGDVKIRRNITTGGRLDESIVMKLDELIQATREGGGVHIGSVNTIDTAKRLADEINFRVRHARRPGVHGG